MAADKPLPPPAHGQAQNDQADLADDISRIVSFLDNKRSHSTERKRDLAQEIAQRREEIGDQRHALPGGARLNPQDRPAQSPSESRSPSVSNNPAITLRYHSFCREMDLLLDSFRARVNSTKPVQH